MRSRRAVLALLLLVPMPGLGTAAWLLWWPGPVGRALFIATKVWILILPVLWLALVERRRPRLPRLCRTGLGAALITGVGMAAVVFATYPTLARWLVNLAALRTTIDRAGLYAPRAYILGALYWCTVNALLEEYVWRWFVFARCAALWPRRAAVVAAALFFTIHHLVAAAAYFGLAVGALASAGIFVGGLVWTWTYARSGNIWAPYVSHVIADGALFTVGYLLIFG